MVSSTRVGWGNSWDSGVTWVVGRGLDWSTVSLDNNGTGDSQGGLLGDSDSGWLTDLLTVGDGDDSRLWAVSGVVSDGGKTGDGLVSVSSQGGGRQSSGDSDGRELHF